MRKIITIVLISVLSLTIGFGSGFSFAKKKYIKLADREIASMKKNQELHDAYIKSQYSNIDKKPITKEKIIPKKKIKDLPKDLPNTIETFGYSSTGNGSPTIITEDEFEFSKNICQTLYYYKEYCVISDADNNYIKNYPELIGTADIWLASLLANSKVIFIKNESQGMDYEILLRNAKWSDNASPTQRGILLSELDPNNVDPEDDDSE